MKRVLVSGSEGFVGQRMIPALVDDYQVTCVDTKLGIDARDFFRSSTERFDLVVHLAAVVGGRAMIEGNPLAVAVDFEIDAALFQWAVRTGQPHVLYFSSSAAYPVELQDGDYLGGGIALAEDEIDLDDIKSPDLSYGLVKLVGEYQAREAQKHGVKVTIARPFSGTGPTQSLDYPVPSIIDRAVRREAPVDIWSNSVRDIVHIDDLVDVALTAVALGIEQPFNIGTGDAVSFSEVAAMAAGVVGLDYDPEIRILSAKPVGVRYRVAEPTFMRSWYTKPLRPVEETIAEMVSARQAELAVTA